MNGYSDEPSTSELISGTELFFNQENGCASYSRTYIDIPDSSVVEERPGSEVNESEKHHDYVKRKLGAKLQQKSAASSQHECVSKSNDSNEASLVDLKRQVLLRQLDLFDKEEEALQKISSAADSIVSIKDAVELASTAVFAHYQRNN